MALICELEYEPNVRQAEAHSAPERFVLFGGAMRGGKSVCGCMEGLQLSLEYPGNVGLICRWELSSLKRTTLVTFFKFCPPELIKRHNKAEGIIELINGSIILYMGLKPSSEYNALERLKSLELGWFFIDEPTELQKRYFDLLKTRLSLRLPDGRFPRYRALLASNPEPGWVRHTFIDQKLDGHNFIPALPKDNPHLEPNYVEDMKNTLPPELVAKFLEGDWDVIEGGNYVFPYGWIRAAVERSMEKSEPVEAGIDVARYGGDNNVAAMRWGPVVRIVYSSNSQDTMQTTGELANVLDEYNPESAKVDVIGVGAGLYDRLLEQNYPVVEVVGGATAHNPEKFVNAKAENHWGFRQRLESENVDLPDDPRVTSQLAGIKYVVQSDRRVKIESKEEMKKRGVESPDFGEAVIYSFAEGTGARPDIWDL